jgi:hypothetical protein
MLTIADGKGVRVPFPQNQNANILDDNKNDDS